MAVIVARVTILSAALDAALAAQGFTDARYRIASVGLDSTRIVDVQLGAELAANELVLRYHPLDLLRLEVEELAVAGLQLDLAAIGNEAAPGPLARLLMQGQTRDETPPASLPRLRVADATAVLPDGLRVTLTDLAWQPTADAENSKLTIGHLDAARAAQGIAADDVTAEIRPGREPFVHFTAASLRHDVADPVLAPFALDGTVTRGDKDWHLAATAIGPHVAQLILTARYDGETAVGRIALPLMRFVPGAVQPADIFRPLATLESVTGTVTGHLAINWRAGHPVVPSGALRIEAMSFKTQGVPIEALAAQLALVGEGAGAKPAVRIDEARVTIAGGEIAAERATLRPLADTNRLVLQARNIDLAVLLAAFDIDGVSGEGLISGRLPVLLATDDVAIEAGSFEAQGPGVLRIASSEAAAALAQGGADTHLLLQALADFRFERLALTLDKPVRGESRLTINTLGHNPAVLDGHPFQVNVSVTTNLDKILGVVVQGGRLSQDIIRAIVGGRDEEAAAKTGARKGE